MHVVVACFRLPEAQNEFVSASFWLSVLFLEQISLRPGQASKGIDFEEEKLNLPFASILGVKLMLMISDMDICAVCILEYLTPLPRSLILLKKVLPLPCVYRQLQQLVCRSQN